MQVSTRIAAAVAAAALSLAALGAPAYADKPAPKESCAKEQTQLGKAEDALDRVTAVFNSTEDKVKKAKKQRVAKATKRLADCLAEEAPPATS